MAKPSPAPSRHSTDRALDEALDESFPASDPPAHSGITGTGKTPDKQPGARLRPEKARRPPSPSRDDSAKPKGTPNSDRHAAETLQGWEDDPQP
jgi:hypothetical protein